MKFRKKPVVIEAVQWTGANMHDIMRMINHWYGYRWGKEPNELILKTREGEIPLMPNDWIIQDAAGEHHSCKPDTFAATYEPAE